MAVPHCARGTKLCNKCKDAADNPQICLVEVFLVPGMITRPVGQFPIGDKDNYYEFDVLRVFTDEMEAREHARDHPEPEVKILL